MGINLLKFMDLYGPKFEDFRDNYFLDLKNYLNEYEDNTESLFIEFHIIEINKAFRALNESLQFEDDEEIFKLIEKRFSTLKKILDFLNYRNIKSTNPVLENINSNSNNKKKEVDFNEGSRAVALKFATGAFDKYCDFDAAEGDFKLKTKMSNPELGKEVFKNDDFAFEIKEETGKISLRKTFENNIKNTLSNSRVPPQDKNLRNNHKALKNTIIYCIENNLKISNLFLKICDYCNAKTYNDKEDKCLLYNDLDFMEKFHDHLVKHETLITEYFKERLSNLRINK